MDNNTIKNKIADIAIMYYDADKTKFDMKEALDALWNDIDGLVDEELDDLYKCEVYDMVLDIISGCPYDNIDDMEEYLMRMMEAFKFVDEKIDDGLDFDDDSEDEYVMMRSYDFKYKKVNFHLKLYYGNNTLEVGSYHLD